MDRWEGKVAIVTGASAGIGAIISEDLVKAGILVVGLARRLKKLEELSASLNKAKGKLYARQCDVTKEKDLLDAFKWVNDEFGGFDILVNNAGVITNARFIDDNIDSYRKILDVNVLATAISVREAVASMKRRGLPGHIIIINSIFGHYVQDPDLRALSLYTSSKHAVTGLTETVRKELATEVDNKIKITSLSPGNVKTQIIDAAGGFPGSGDPYAKMLYLDSKDISNAVLYILGTPPKVQVTELTIRPLNENV